jgi:hypothetical protein
MALGKVAAWKGGDCSKVKGQLAKRTTSEFEARTDGWTEKCDKGRRAG